jgi:hypothetical protein
LSVLGDDVKDFASLRGEFGGVVWLCDSRGTRLLGQIAGRDPTCPGRRSDEHELGPIFISFTGVDVVSDGQAYRGSVGDLVR